MADELQADTNRLNRLFQKFSQESKAVSIAIVSLVIAALSLLMAWLAVYDATTAKVTVEIQNQQIQDLEDEFRLLELYVMELTVELKDK